MPASPTVYMCLLYPINAWVLKDYLTFLLLRDMVHQPLIFKLQVTKRVKVEKESVDLKFQYLEFWAKNYAKVPVR